MRSSQLCFCLSFLVVLFLIFNPIVLIFPYVVGRSLFSEEEVLVGRESWPKEGEKEEFFTHHYVHLAKTLNGNPTNVTFHYVEAGDPKKETIVFTMGASEPASIYAPIMKELVDQYHLISIDGKGFPYSSTHRSNKVDLSSTDPASDYDPYVQGEEMVSALDKIGVKKFNLVSSDLMSIVTGFWVPRYQERVLRYFRGQSHVAVQTYSAVPQGLFFKTFPELAETLLSAVRVSIWRFITGTTGFPFFEKEKRVAKTFQLPEEFNNKIIKVLRAGSVVPWVYFWLSLPRPTILIQVEEFKEIRCPVLLLQGIEDKAQPVWFYDGSVRLQVDVMGDQIVAKLHEVPEEEREKYRAEAFFPKASWIELVWVEESGHFPHFEKPKEYLFQLKRFLSVPTQF